MTTQQPDVRIALITASVRPDRFGPVVTEWMHEQITAHGGFEIDALDLMDFDLPVGLDGSGDADRFRARLAAADGFVLVTPEYNHGYPGYLKIAIDTAFEEWSEKPLGFVSYGGSAGGARSVAQLRGVFTELQVVTLREQVVLTRVWDCFQDGRMVEPDGPASAAKGLLSKLLPWAERLRAVRAADG